MPADLDQFGRENSHGTVVGGKGFVELSHVTADTRTFLYQVDFETVLESHLNGFDLLNGIQGREFDLIPVFLCTLW